MIQKITLNRGQVLTRNEIAKMLNVARSTFTYAKVTLFDKNYLTITFHRDNTIEIATSSRELSLWNQIKSLRVNYTQTRLVDFMFRWINTQNR